MNAADTIGLTHIFADESGKLSEPDNNIVILAAVIIYGDRGMGRVKSYFKYLKEMVAKWGISVDDSRFEFHAADIFNRRERWRKLTDEQLDRLSQTLRNAIKETGISFVLVKIDKREKGFHNFLADYDDVVKSGMSLFTEEQKNQVNKILGRHGVTGGVGRIGHVTSLFFGLTTAQMEWEGFKGNAEAVVDEQFLTGIETWQFSYELNAQYFSLFWELVKPDLETKTNLAKWPKNKSPSWHLGNKVEIEDSCNHLGLQLADFLAYTTRCLEGAGNPLGGRYALVNETDLVSAKFGNADGVWVTTSTRAMAKFIPKSLISNKKWFWNKKSLS